MSDERKFIHDIASPLSVLMLMLDQMIDRAEAANLSDLSDNAKDCKQTVQKVIDLLRARREKIITDPNQG